MPAETRIRKEFGRLICEIMQDDSLGQARTRTGISRTYINDMKSGTVPGRQIVERFAAGYDDRMQEHGILVIRAICTRIAPELFSK